MPNLDGTGPDGQGSMSGLGLGPCGQNRPRKRLFGRNNMRRSWFDRGRRYFGSYRNQTNDQA